jgi:hypothetical protein
MDVSVVRGESAVGVPLRRLFRYEWMDVNKLLLDLLSKILLCN